MAYCKILSYASFFKIIIRITSIDETYSIKPTYGCNDIKILKERSQSIIYN